MPKIRRLPLDAPPPDDWAGVDSAARLDAVWQLTRTAYAFTLGRDVAVPLRRDVVRVIRGGLSVATTLVLAGCGPDLGEHTYAYDSELDVFTKVEGPSTGTVGAELTFTTEATVEPGRYASVLVDVRASADGREIRPYYRVGQLLSGSWTPLVRSKFTFRPTATGTYTAVFRRGTATSAEPATLPIEVK